MVAASGGRLEELAQELFEVVTHLCLTAPRGRRRSGDLREIEFLALALLQERKTMIVGDMQRQLGVLPAQMSRVIRALEDHPGSFITCRINARDKRKVDVCLTDVGAKALADYQAARVQRIAESLSDLSDNEQDDLVRLLERIRTALERNASAASSDVNSSQPTSANASVGP